MIMETEIQNETIFYQNLHVKVTQSRFVTNSRTYAMRNISSVFVYEIVKSKTLPVIMMIIGFLMLFSSEALVETVGAILLITGVFVFFSIKNEFAVRISTNSGEANSVISKDKKYIQSIVEALNEAIIRRG